MMAFEKARATKLHCRRCAQRERDLFIATGNAAIERASKGLRIERGVQRRQRGTHTIEVVTVTCPRGHEWWSQHATAIARSRKRDARAKAKVRS